MELNNFETLDRHPLQVEKTNNLGDWSVPQHGSWDEETPPKLADTVIVVELPCSDTKTQMKSIYPLNIDNTAGNGTDQKDYLELGLFGLIVLATVIVLLRQ